MKLNPNFIPHNEFHKGIWLKSPDCDWFFFLDTPRTFEIPKNGSFYSSVDEDLKTLVKKLHQKNIPTTPSCSGHIENKANHLKLFNSLEKLSNEIKKDGIKLGNPESNEKYFYKNPKFSLPFSREKFLETIDDYQKWGVLGMQNKDNLYEKIENKLPVNKIDDLVMIFTKGDSKNRISKNWSDITKLISSVI